MFDRFLSTGSDGLCLRDYLFGGSTRAEWLRGLKGDFFDVSFFRQLRDPTTPSDEATGAAAAS
jgi:hypothetical protein